jgi:Tfp pilus assembly protein PilF
MRLLWILATALAALLGGCAQMPAQTTTGITELAARPAEGALLAGIRAYEDGQYPQAEKRLNEAVQAGLASAKDRAAAHKYLAFIYCTSQRAAQCEAAFRAARSADAGFALSKSEAGHPLWGAVYARSQR